VWLSVLRVRLPTEVSCSSELELQDWLEESGVCATEGVKANAIRQSAPPTLTKGLQNRAVSQRCEPAVVPARIRLFCACGEPKSSQADTIIDLHRISR
jgi:hypothetical protein